jgi:hypothetical protein
MKYRRGLQDRKPGIDISEGETPSRSPQIAETALGNWFDDEDQEVRDLQVGSPNLT